MKQILVILSAVLFGIATANGKEIQTAQRTPAIVVQFESGKSQFNNYVALQEKIKSSNGVMISANTNADNLSIADARIQNVVKHLDMNKFVYTTFRYTNNAAEHDFIEIFSLNTQDEFPVLLRAINSSSMVSGLGRLYTESDIRQWRFEVEEKDIVLEGGVAAVEQLSVLLKSTGWKLTDSPAFMNEEGKLIEAMPLKMKVILVNGVTASMDEVKSLVDSWLDIYKKNIRYTVEVNKKDNSVVIKS